MTTNLNQLDPLGLQHTKIQSLHSVFQKSLITNSNTISTQQFSYILAKFVNYQPVQISNMLNKVLNNSPDISWDQFLQILHKDGYVRQQILDQIINPKIQQQMIPIYQDLSTETLAKLIKQKGLQLRKLQEWQSHNYHYYVALIQDQLLLIDSSNGKINTYFDYMTLPLDMSKMQRKKILNSKQFKSSKNESNSHDLQTGIITNNLKKSITLIKQQNNQNGFKRVVTQTSNVSISKRVRRKTIQIERPKKNYLVNINKSDVPTIFNLFTQLPIQKSIVLCRMYNDNDKQISLDKSLFNRQKTTRQHNNPHLLLKKSTLNSIKQSLQQMQRDKQKLSYNPRSFTTQDDPTPPTHLYQKPKQVRNKITAMQNNITKNKLYINWYSIQNNYLMIALVTKQLRFFRIKKSFFNKVNSELIMIKNCRYAPVYVRIYTSKITLKLNVVVGCQQQNQMKLRIYEYNQIGQSKTLYQIFVDTINFFPIFQQVQGVRLALFNQIGFLNLYQLNSLQSVDCIRIEHKTQLINPKTQKKMPISTVRYHFKTLSLFVGCLDGYIYNIVQSNLELRKFKKITNGSILCSQIYHDKLLLVYCTDNKCRILKLDNLQIGSILDLDDCRIGPFKFMFNPKKKQDSNFFYLYGQTVKKIGFQVNGTIKKQQIRFKNLNQQQRKMLTMFQTQSRQQTQKQNIINIKQYIVWIRVSNQRLIVCFNTGFVKVYNDCGDEQVSFLENYESSNIVSAQLSKNGVLMVITTETFQTQVRNIYNQQVLLKVTIPETSNLFLFPQANKFLLNINTCQGFSYLLPLNQKRHGKQVLKNHNCQITASQYYQSQLITGDEQGNLCIYAKNNYSYKYILKLDNYSSTTLVNFTIKRPIKKICCIKSSSNILVNIGNVLFVQVNIFEARIISNYSYDLSIQKYEFYDFTQKWLLFLHKNKIGILLKNSKQWFQLAEIKQSQKLFLMGFGQDKIIYVNKKGQVIIYKKDCNKLKNGNQKHIILTWKLLY